MREVNRTVVPLNNVKKSYQFFVIIIFKLYLQPIIKN